MKNDSTPTPAPIGLRLPGVLAILGISRSRLYDGIARGEFPAPRKLGRSSVWIKSEIEAVLTSLPTGGHDCGRAA